MTAVMMEEEVTDLEEHPDIVHPVCRNNDEPGRVIAICGKHLKGIRATGDEIVCLDCQFIWEADLPCVACGGKC
jgi:hypothetical protein